MGRQALRTNGYTRPDTGLTVCRGPRKAVPDGGAVAVSALGVARHPLALPADVAAMAGVVAVAEGGRGRQSTIATLEVQISRQADKCLPCPSSVVTVLKCPVTVGRVTAPA